MVNPTANACLCESPKTPTISAALARSPFLISSPANEPALIGFQGARAAPFSA